MTDEPSHKNGWLGGENAHLGSQQRETRWLTPPYVVESLGGDFELDPCGAPGHELADRTFLLENGEDGLSLSWAKPSGWPAYVFCNPPYGKEQLPFMRRMVQHNNGIALIFARTETASFFETVWDSATAVLFLKSRISFLDADGNKSKANAGAPSCLVAYGDRALAALSSCTLPGHLVRLQS